MSVTLAFQFLSNPCVLCQYPCFLCQSTCSLRWHPWFLCRYLSFWILLCRQCMWEGPRRPSTVRSQWRCARDTRTRGEDGGTLVTIFLRWGGAQNYSGVQCIVPRRFPIPNSSLAPSPTGNLKGKLSISCVTTTSRPQLRSVHWPIQVRVKWVPRFILPRVDSNSIVRLEPPSRACHSLRVKTEKHVSVFHGSSYRSYPYFPFTKNPGAYLLAHTCRYWRHNTQIRHRWWCQSGFPISLVLGRHLLSLRLPYPEVSPTLICCVLGGWGVHHIRR